MINKNYEYFIHSESQDRSNQKLLMKLRSAMIYIQHTCVLGACNKITDLVRTARWVGFLNTRYNGTGVYRKIKADHVTDWNFHTTVAELTNKDFISGSFCTPHKCEYMYVQSTLAFSGDSGFILIQAAPGEIPDSLYYFNKENTNKTINLALRPRKDRDCFLKKLFPAVINHKYPKASPLMSKDLDLISQYTWLTNQQWYFYPDTIRAEEYRLSIKQLFQDPNQLLSEDSAAWNIMGYALLTIESRMGNCGQRACLLSKYLWEHDEGIDLIEIALMKTFDHCLVIINRKTDSDIHNSLEWGDDCFVMDAWYKETGIIFRADQFPKKINSIRQFVFEQNRQLKAYSIETPEVDFNQQETVHTVYYKIFPKMELYPDYIVTSRYPGGCGYNILNFFSKEVSGKENFPENIENDFLNHSEKFFPCLESIKNISHTKKIRTEKHYVPYTDPKNSFFKREENLDILYDVEKNMNDAHSLGAVYNSLF